MCLFTGWVDYWVSGCLQMSVYWVGECLDVWMCKLPLLSWRPSSGLCTGPTQARACSELSENKLTCCQVPTVLRGVNKQGCCLLEPPPPSPCQTATRWSSTSSSAQTPLPLIPSSSPASLTNSWAILDRIMWWSSCRRLGWTWTTWQTSSGLCCKIVILL